MNVTRHFACTACGKCCHGQLPLTLKDALAHAGRFPLALLWTPLRKGSKDFPLVAHLGVTVPLAKHPGLAALVVPTSYLPPKIACPALGADMLCTIHDQKPSRCKSMPFYPYREERYQAELLTPRAGWECDTSDTAPIVFSAQKIIDRDDYDRERRDIEEQAPIIQMFANYLFKYNPLLMATLANEAKKPKPGQIVSSLSSFLTATRNPDAGDIARRQVPVLASFVEQTAGQPELHAYHLQYAAWLEEMKFLAGVAPKAIGPV
jgi:Fe-S-cluster containining protein